MVPGDVLRLEIEMTNKRTKFVGMSGKAYVEDTLVAEAEFMAAIVDR